MKKQRIAGFDVGTSSLKITLADPDTGLITENLKYDYAGFSELSPGVVPVKVYEENLQRALFEITGEYELLAMALDTQMYSVCAVEDGQTIAYQWNSLWEKRPELEDNFAHHLRRSGCQLDTLFGAYKIATNSNPNRTFLPYGIKEYLLKYLTGTLATDYCTASAVGLLDIYTKRWNLPFVEMLGFKEHQMPKLFRHDMPFGTLHSQITRCETTTVVVPGLGDGPSASYACRQIGLFCGNLGTSMAARIFTNSPDLSSQSPLYTQVIDEELYITGGISSNACSVFTWSNNLGFQTASQLKDTKDLQFIPWIHGERAPYWSSSLRGTFLGMQADTTKEDISVAILKAIGFTFVTIARILEQYKRKGDPLILAGGGSNSMALLNLIAGCLDTEVAILKDADYLCSSGSVISAAQGIGLTVDPQMKIDMVISPDCNHRDEYEKWLKTAQSMVSFYDK